ncbi:cyclic nucleotide-binding domain-containing protein [bacterium]|nr:cyclic nucleotide-binding domain-containing protein [bacterium]
MSEAHTEFLTQVSLFMELDTSDLDKISTMLVEETYDRDSIVIAEGVPGEALYILSEGEVKVEKIFYDEKVNIATLKVGSAFGEMALVDNYPTSATVTASKDSVLLVLYKEKLVPLLDSEPNLASKFWKSLSRILCNRIRAGNENLREYFVINQALIANPQFRDLYALSHGASMK